MPCIQKWICFLWLLMAALPGFSQDSVSVQQPGTSMVVADSLLSAAVADSVRSDLSDSIPQAPAPVKTIDYRKAYWETVNLHPLIGKSRGKTIRIPMIHRKTADKDEFFYLICGIVFLLGVLRQGFGKYFHDLFRVIFRSSSFRQKQVREQMQQAPLASLLMNFFFVLTGGVYISLLLHHFEKVAPGSFWSLTGLCVAALAMLYLLKFLVLKLTGWIFAISEGMQTYNFIVFTINKFLGILLVPIPALIAFATPGIRDAAITLSWCMVAGMFLFRYFLAWMHVAQEVKVSRFHFFLYLCAFEIAPLLIIYKGLSEYL